MAIVLGSEGLVRVTGGSDDGTSAFAELTFSHVNLRRCVVGGRAVDSVEVAVVGPILNLEVGGRRLGMMAVARSFEFDAVKTLGWLLGWLLGTLGGMLGWLASLNVLSVLESLRLVIVLLRALGLSVARLLVDVNFLTVLRRLLGRLLRMTKTLLFVDADLFLDLGVVGMRSWRLKGG